MIDLTDEASTHPGTAEPMADIVNRRLSRRKLIGSGGVIAAAAFLGGGRGSAMRPAGAGAAQLTGTAMSPLLGFEPIPLGFDDHIVVPNGYTARAILPWGDPILPNGPAFRVSPTPPRNRPINWVWAMTAWCTSRSTPPMQAAAAACW